MWPALYGSPKEGVCMYTMLFMNAGTLQAMNILYAN